MWELPSYFYRWDFSQEQNFGCFCVLNDFSEQEAIWFYPGFLISHNLGWSLCTRPSPYPKSSGFVREMRGARMWEFPSYLLSWDFVRIPAEAQKLWNLFDKLRAFCFEVQWVGNWNPSNMAVDFKSLTEATSGAVGGLLSTTILYPLDTCKSKYQAEARAGASRKYKYDDDDSHGWTFWSSGKESTHFFVSIFWSL